MTTDKPSRLCDRCGVETGVAKDVKSPGTIPVIQLGYNYEQTEHLCGECVTDVINYCTDPRHPNAPNPDNG